MHMAIHFKSMRRNVLIAILLASLATAVAFAILQGRAVITGNTISTSSADLLVSTDGVNYSRTIPGFNFADIIPGGWPAPADGYPIYVKNAGATDLDLQLTLDNAPSNPASADLSKINVALTDASGDTVPRGFILQSLVGATKPIEGDLAPGAIRKYKLQALAADDADPGKTIGNIDLALVGTPRDPNAPTN